MINNTRKMNDFLNELKEQYLKNEYIMMRVNALVEMDEFDIQSLYDLRNVLKDQTYLKDSIEIYSKEKFKENSYIKNIKLEKIETPNFILSKGRLIFRDMVSLFDEENFDTEKLIPKPSFFVCPNTLHCPVIAEKEYGRGIRYNTWMSVEPFEINSFKKIVEEAKGNILVLGLGLGYVTYMLSEKEDVKHIDVVEINREIIDLFEDNILDQFPNKDKINIINDDAVNYLSMEDLNKYNYVNFDIHRTVEDMLENYLYTLSIEEKYDDIKFSYWLETELKAYVQKGIVRSAIGYGIEDYAFDSIGQYIIDKEDINTIDDFKKVVELKDFRKTMLDYYKNNKEEIKIKTKDISLVIKSQQI